MLQHTVGTSCTRVQSARCLQEKIKTYGLQRYKRRFNCHYLLMLCHMMFDRIPLNYYLPSMLAGVHVCVYAGVERIPIST